MRLESARWAAYKILKRKYGFGFAWDSRSALDYGGTEDFNNPHILARGEDFIDAGAAYGLWSIRASPFYKRVIAVEPDPRMIHILDSNIRINRARNVTVIPSCLGGEIGQTVLYKYGQGESSVLASHMGRMANGDEWEVGETTIDRLVSTLDFQPSVIKLDVEGAEIEALQGAKATITRFKPKLLVEVHLPVTPEQVMATAPDYKWTTRWRYLDDSTYPSGKQPHLLGMAK